jgi:hypothetical protein
MPAGGDDLAANFHDQRPGNHRSIDPHELAGLDGDTVTYQHLSEF